MNKKKVIIVGSFEKRQRYRYVYDPLLISSFRTELFLESRNLFIYLVKSLFFVIKNRDSNQIIIFGGDLKNLIWFFLSKIIKSKIIMRLGGDPFSVRHSKIDALKLEKNYRGLIKIWVNYRITKWLIKHIQDYILVNVNILIALQKFKKNEINFAIIPQYVETGCNLPRINNGPHITLLTVSNFSYYEKLLSLTKILKYLITYQHKIPEVNNYYIVGGGSYLRILNTYISEFNAKSEKLSVNLIGYTKDVYKYLNEADIFLYCSTLDSTPNVLLEAKAHGLPVIINKFTPFLELFHEGQNCYFFDINDEYQFISKLIKLIRNKAIRYEMGKNNLEDVKINYSKDRIALKIEDFLTTVH